MHTYVRTRVASAAFGAWGVVERGIATLQFRAKYYTPGITKVIFNLEMPLTIHFKMPLKIHDDL